MSGTCGIRMCALLLFALVWAATALHAATITVTSTADTGPDAPLAGTLRAALANAADGDTIDLTAITGTITLMAGMTTSAELVVDKSVTILGFGPANLTVDANHLSRVFRIEPGLTVTIEGLRIVNGEAPLGSLTNSGGGIYNDHSTLTVNNCTLSGNSASSDFSGSGGGIANDGGASGSAVLTVNNCILSGNSAILGGGIYNRGDEDGNATLTVANSTLNGNSAALGGAIYNDTAYGGQFPVSSIATLTVSNCTINGNSASSGGGIANRGGLGGTATATVDHTILSDNSASHGGGLLNLGDRWGHATLTVNHSTLRGNSASSAFGGSGGGILNVGRTIEDFGGEATLVVNHSTLIANSVAGGDGGGIYNDGSRTNRATATIVNSTLSGNSANSGNGGGIYNDATDDGLATVALGNCTFSGNLAVFGGAINNDEGDVKVLGSTFSGNSATVHGGGIYNSGVPLLNGSRTITTIGNTILKQGASENLNATFGVGRFVSLGFNLSSDDGLGSLTGTGDQINRDPLLGQLADNGGPTLTHLPLAGSPALDRGSSDLMATLGLTTDQRGLPRLFDDPGTPNAPLADGTDIGAVEIQQPTARNLVWTNLAGGDWNVAANWAPNFVPGPSDNAIITNSVTVTVSSPSDCFGLTLGSLSSAPTLTGAGTLTLHGPSAWFSGTMSGAGWTVVEAGATFSIPNTGGGVPVLNTRTLENRGTLGWSRNLLGVIGGAVITNGPGALFLAESPAEATLGGGIAAGRFDNAGDFRKVIGSGPLTFSSGLRFNNSGTVAIEANLLVWGDGFTNNGTVTLSPGTTNRFTAGGSGTGTFFAPPTAVVEWNGGTFTLDSGAQLNGDGLYRISSPATVVANASFMVSNLDLINGTLGGTGTVTIANVMNWTGGTMSGSGRTIIPAGAMLNATLPSGGGLNARTLDNVGTILWTGAGNMGFVSAVITNRPGALFHAQGAGGMTFVSGPSRFDNAGTFRKSVNTGSLDIVDFSGTGSFNNYGTVEIQTGTLLCGAGFNNPGAVNLFSDTTNRLAGGGSATGTFDTPATALVEWTGRSFTLHPGAQLNGPGRYRINGNSANVVGNGDVTVQNFDLVTGDSALTALSGTGRLTINNSMSWTGGAMSGAGRTIIAPAATLSLANANSIGLQRTLENAGTVAWTGPGTIGLLNGVITNRAGAVFEAMNASRLAFSGGSCRFDNVGTFRKSGTAGTTIIDGGLPFKNSGIVDIRSGIVAANGGYSSTPVALLKCALGGTTAGTGYGQLQAAGAVTLNGALSVDLINGFLPTTNDTFTVLTAGTRSGAFTSFSYPSSVVTMQLNHTANSAIVSVSEVLAVPQPVLLPPTLLGNDFLLQWSAVPGIVYRLEFAPTLSPLLWSELAGDITASGTIASRQEALTSSNRLYRVRVLP